MNEFVMFLAEHYEWLLVVVVLIIVTIVGFLADKKKTNEKREIKEEKKASVDMPSFVHDGVTSPIENIKEQNKKEKRKKTQMSKKTKTINYGISM